MRRPWRTWLAFALALLVLFGVTGWITSKVIRLDAAQKRAERNAQREEAIRLALWRMDAAVTPLIAQEAARPYFEYRAFYPAARSYDRMLNVDVAAAAEPLTASQLLARSPAYTRLHFQLDPAGKLTSPQVPDPPLRGRALKGHTTAERIAESARRLAELGKRVQGPALLAHLPAEPPSHVGPPVAAVQRRQGPQRRDLVGQKVLNDQEYQARYNNTIQAQYQIAMPLPRNIRQGVTRPVWLGQTLLLARRVHVDDAAYVQGAWLDWPALKKWLLEGSADLLPHAELKPAAPASAAASVYQLSALPVVLEPGALPAHPAASASALQMSLVTAWGCLLLAVIAVAVLLLGALALGRRRTDFVSAVTHELRTPLTTLYMYAEMLADDMVQDPDQRREYLTTLLAEAGRLRHLVENVLTYARLEARSARRHLQTLSLRRLLAESTDRLRKHAEQNGMELVVETDDADLDTRVRADPWAVEMVLFNLVDNACKYASAGPDRRVHVEAVRRRRDAAIRVRDHGPGIPPRQARHLLGAFRRAAPDSADVPKGVGLGLAIATHLARNMSGRLTLEPPAHTPGASVALTLPLAPDGDA